VQWRGRPADSVGCDVVEAGEDEDDAVDGDSKDRVGESEGEDEAGEDGVMMAFRPFDRDDRADGTEAQSEELGLISRKSVC
jgi:hypothetical protein